MYRSRDSHSSNPGRSTVWTWLPLVGLLALLPALSAAPPAAAPVPTTDAGSLDKKVLAEAKNGSQIMTNLTHLSDVIGPRLTGSAALKQANEWAADKMRAAGLSNVHLAGSDSGSAGHGRDRSARGQSARSAAARQTGARERREEARDAREETGAVGSPSGPRAFRGPDDQSSRLKL